jgi:hypothetical protein
MKTQDENVRLVLPVAQTLFSCPACRSDFLVLWSEQDRTAGRPHVLSCAHL